MDSASKPLHEQAFRHVMAHRTMLKAYILAIVRDPELAEETLSDAVLEMVRSWERFDPSRPFEFWARGVARRVALANLRKRRNQPLSLSEEALEAVGAAIDSLGDEVLLETRKEALARCLEMLSSPNRRLVELRYFENRTYQEMAAIVQRSLNALYVAFNRIHEALSKCLQQRLGLP
jgi:RNA polymerase sigma-70 factor (ECF subfamily)